MADTEGEGNKSNEEVQKPVQPETNEANKNESNKVEHEPKKRKAITPRSDVWESYTKIKIGDEVKKAKCRHCNRELLCDSRRNCTSSLLSHLKICKKNPNKNSDSSQGTLQVQPTTGDGSHGTISTWKFDPDELRNAFAEMIIEDELPFAFCEHPGFRKFMAKACPHFIVPSRRTATRIATIRCEIQKEKLAEFFKNCERVCLTTDTWTSNTQQNYMSVTAHFIDSDWKLHKKIIGFFLVKDHKGDDIGKSLEQCLVEWGIDKVFTITVDNASTNDGAINYMRKALNSSECSIVDGKYLHMRCAAHIINLIVTDGLKEVDVSVSRIRAAVKYIRNSLSRLAKFKKCAELAKVDNKAFLKLDVCTRWNSTYLILKAAINYEKVFDRYDEEDPYYAIELCGVNGPGVIEPEDWVNAKKMAEFLKHFYDVTLRISATQYVTSNIFLHDIAELLLRIREWCRSDDRIQKEMGQRMLAKFCKYRGNPENMNLLIFIGVVIDPRYKLSNYVKLCIQVLFGDTEGDKLWDAVTACFYALFEQYKKIYSPSDKDPSPTVYKEDEEDDRILLKTVIAQKMKTTHGVIGTSKTEAEKYLAEENEEDNKQFDILKWWKCNSARFPILSRLARDVLAIPISTVASESAFSAGGRVLDDFRSSLTPSMVQRLICTQDWLRSSPPISIEEDLEKLSQSEEELIAEKNGCSSKSKTDSVSKPTTSTSPTSKSVKR